MRAAVHHRYGPPEVLRVEEVEPPVPQADELLVRVRASTVNRTDTGFRRPELFLIRFFAGLRRPKRPIVGLEFAGEVEAVGARVTEFAPGDRVFGMRGGSNAELVCVRERGVVARMPDGVSFAEAAAVCDGAIQALTHLRRANVGPGTRVLVYGASGSCGTAAVQLGKHLGAHITAVCNGKNVELVRSLGADEVIDYEREDYTKRGETYDVVLDAVAKTTFTKARRVLNARGFYVATDNLRNIALALVTRWSGKQVVFALPRQAKADVLLLKGLIEAGEYRAVIDRSYPLDEIVEAHRYVETGQKTGNVVVTI